MRSRHRRVVQIGQQHGQTVCHHDGASQPALGGDAGIRRCAVWGCAAQLFNANTMYLFEKHSLRAHGFL